VIIASEVISGPIEQYKKELEHKRVEEIYRGKPLIPDKIIGIIKIFSA